MQRIFPYAMSFQLCFFLAEVSGIFEIYLKPMIYYLWYYIHVFQFHF